MKLCEVARDWIEYRRKQAELGLINWSTFSNQRGIAETWINALGDHEITEVRKSHIELIVGHRLKVCKPVTIQGELNVLRQIFNWAIDEGTITARPRFPTVRMPTTEDPLPEDEAFSWHLKNLPDHHSDAIQFMLLTGLAPHELERIRKTDIGPTGDMRDGAASAAIYIGQRADFAVKQPSRRRVIPLNECAMAIWKKCTWSIDDDANPFPTVAAMQKAMRRLVLERPDAPPQADGLTPKFMRKWFASKLATECSEAVLQRLLGHAPGSPITRRHYVRSNDRQIAEAVESIKGPGER